VKRTPLERSTPLARTGRLPRRTRMAAKNAKRGGHRFPKGVDEAFREYVRGLPCLMRSHAPWWSDLWQCDGPVECAHVKTRGAGGADAGNIVPLCRRHHAMQHAVGIRTFQSDFALDLRAAAARVWADHRGDE
jgi:hypothetical protein